MKLSTVVIPLVTVLLFTSCKKSNTVLPSPTQNGSNTVAYVINGQSQIVTGVISWNNSEGIQYNIFTLPDSTKGIEIYSVGNKKN